MRRIMAVCIIVLALAGCGERRIDSTSDESFQKSIAAIKESLSDDKKETFEEALRAIAASQIGSLLEVATDPEGAQRRIKDQLDGKTADEIIAEGNRILDERRKKEREQTLAEIEEVKTKIDELEKKQRRSELDKDSLLFFKVLRSRFYYEDQYYITRPVIELTVKNETKHAVSRAYFNSVLSTAGREVPWVEDQFNYSIPGGVEPGEKVTWKLSPNMFGDWSNAPKDRNDMVLTVTVMRLDGADGEAMFNSQFPEWEENQLTIMKNRLDQLQKALIKSE